MAELTSGLAIVRHSARVVVLDAESNVLLFRISPRMVEHEELWITPGGGIEDGESAEQAARRELREETGFDDAGLTRCIWRRRHVSVWNGRTYDSRESYFLCRVTGLKPAPDFSDPTEVDAVVDVAWWAAEEIRRSGAVFAPRGLGELLPRLFSGVVNDVVLEIED